MNTEDVLKDSIKTGEVISVIYHAGSKPGTIRNLAIISITGNKYRARCYDTNRVKTFLIDKTEIPADGKPKPKHRNERDLLDEHQTLESLAAAIETALIAMGWTPHFENNSLELYRKYKNGKQHKRPDAVIYYDPVSYAHEYDYNTGETITTEHETEKVWHVYFKKHTQDNRAFKYLEKAARHFIRHIKADAPIPENADQLTI